VQQHGNFVDRSAFPSLVIKDLYARSTVSMTDGPVSGAGSANWHRPESGQCVTNFRYRFCRYLLSCCRKHSERVLL